MGEPRVLVLIPARYASSRFPGKPLAKIAGKSMIQRVYQNCTDFSGSDDPPTLKIDAYVVTDDQRIEDHVKEFGGKVLRVDDNVPSGTERINLAYQRNFKNENYQLIINVQGDEPLLKVAQLEQLANFHLGSEYDLCTLVKSCNDWVDFNDPHNVKAIYSREQGRCLYFSRAPIPFDRDGNLRHEWFLHIGVYSFKPQALEKMCQANHTYYEQTEKLEQLRALEIGLAIGAIETNLQLMGVDVPEDISKLEGVLGE